MIISNIFSEKVGIFFAIFQKSFCYTIEVTIDVGLPYNYNTNIGIQFLMFAFNYLPLKY